MKRLSKFKIFSSLLIYLYIPALLFSQTLITNNSTDLLKKDFPNLVEKFHEKISKQSADYIIAVDISLSMKTYWKEVKSGLEAFIKEIPDNDYVSIIFFGDEAKVRGIPSTITSETRSVIISYLNVIPTDRNTDLADMTEKILNEMNRPGSNNLKYVFIFTDFKDEPKSNSRFIDNRDKHWTDFSNRFNNEQSNKIIETIALQLPLSKEAGKDIPRIKNVFKNLSLIEIKGNMLNQWFDRKKAEIQRDRLRSVIYEELLNEGLFIDTLPQIVGNKICININKRNETITESLEFSDISFQLENFSSDIVFNKSSEKISSGIKDNTIILGKLSIKNNPFFEKNFNITGYQRFICSRKLIFHEEIKRLELQMLKSFDNNLLNKEYNLKINDYTVLGIIPSYITYFLILIIILFISCSIWTYIRPLSINGRITLLMPNGLPMRTKEIIKLKNVSLGAEGDFDFEMKDVNWKVSFKIKRNCPCLLWKKAGIYFLVERGNITAKIDNPGAKEIKEIRLNENTRITKGVTINFEEYKILYN